MNIKCVILKSNQPGGGLWEFFKRMSQDHAGYSKLLVRAIAYFVWFSNFWVSSGLWCSVGRCMAAKAAPAWKIWVLRWLRAWAIWIPCTLWFHYKILGLPIRRRPGCRFSAHIPSRKTCEGKTRWGRETVSLFTAGSRLAWRIGGEVHCRQLSISSSFQVKVAVIKVA